MDPEKAAPTRMVRGAQGVGGLWRRMWRIAHRAVDGTGAAPLPAPPAAEPSQAGTREIRVRWETAAGLRALPALLGRARAPLALLLLGTVVEAIWLATQHIGFTVDSREFYELALWLSGHAPANYSLPTYRAPGYPFFLILTGVPSFNTLTGLLLAQAAMAIAIPILIYGSMRLIAPRVAFVTGLCAVLLLVPFAYSKSVMTEQLFLFLLFVLIYLVAHYLARGDARSVYLLAVCAIALLLTRPVANLLFVLVLGVAFLAHPRQYRHHLLALGFVFVCVVGWSNVRALWAYEDLQGTRLDRFALLMLHEVYFAGAAATGQSAEPVFRAEYGPASAAVVQGVRTFARDHPDAWVTRQPEPYFGAYRNDPDAFATAVLTQPRKPYFAIVPLAMETVYGAEPGRGDDATNRLLLQAAAETMRARPQVGLAFLWKRLSGSTTSVGGQGIFFNAYVSAQYYGGGSLYDGRQPLVRPTNGPATRELLETVAEYLALYPQAWQDRLPFEMFGAFKDDPAALIENILARPHYDYALFLWNVGDSLKGPDASPRLFLNAAYEAFRVRPAGLLVFMDNLLMYLVGPQVWYDSGYRLSALPVTFLATDDRELPEALQQELHDAWSPANRQLTNRFWRYFGWLRLAADSALFLLALVTGLYAWRGPIRLPFLFLMSVVLYQALVVSLLYEPRSRYVDATILVLLMAAMTGLAAARRPTSPPAASPAPAPTLT